jgi:hypothetical protein
MKEIWKNAKENKKILLFENFQKPEITWDEVLSFVYEQSSKYNSKIIDEAKKTNGSAVGNILAFNGYFFIKENNLFSTFKGVKELLKKVNGGESGENCSFYKNNRCDCKLMWHTQALRFSITKHVVSDHNDPNDVLYWQILGNSTWIINNDKEYVLKPGDLFYFNKEDSHIVKEDGPRSGIIIDNLVNRDY